MKPDTFTITTFWLDWLLMPALLAGAWLTIRWALADLKRAPNLPAGGASFAPAWSFSMPLFIAAAAWVIAGFGTLIKEDYWEMRVIFGAFSLWTLCSIVGAVLLLLDFLRKGRGFGVAGILNLIGLAFHDSDRLRNLILDHAKEEGER